jgi:hypothetical protein
MIQIHEVEEQLKKIGCNFRFFGRSEIKELAKILLPGETIAKATNGMYEAGFAMLVVTDQRLLLVDKKPMFLTIEDIRFDMIAEINYHYRLLNSSAHIFSTNKTVTFTTWNHARLRSLVEYLQQQVMMLRHQHASAVGEHIHNRLQEQFAKIAPPIVAQVPALPESTQAPERTQVKSKVTYREQTPEVVPQIAYVAMQSTSSTEQPHANPYAHKLPALSRRRKFPSFY